MGADDIQALVGEENSLASSTRGRWRAEYLGRSYRSAVEMAMAQVGRGFRTVLKTDLWNECLGGAREIAGYFHERDGLRFFGLDLLHPVCVEGRARVPAMHVVQADIRALPFRAGSFDAVLDLSTLDHLPEAGVAEAIGGSLRPGPFPALRARANKGGAHAPRDRCKVEGGVDGYVILRIATKPAKTRRPTSMTTAHPESVG